MPHPSAISLRAARFFSRSSVVSLAGSLALLAGCGAMRPPQPTRVGPSTATYTAAPAAGIAIAPAPSEVANVVMPAPEPTSPSFDRPGLATQWGESMWSPITNTPFVRDAQDPWATAIIHYNDAEGVAAHAAHLGTVIAPLVAMAGSDDISVSLVTEDGQVLPGVRAGARNLVAARAGDRYRILVRNNSSARLEIVTSVDGLDVIDGQPAGVDRRGYVVAANDQLVIDGFRQSDDTVAAFRFGRVADSYAARTTGANNVGVIGVAMFVERGTRWTPPELDRRDHADPFPAGRSFAAAPQ
jgi:hypothetical protein